MKWVLVILIGESAPHATLNLKVEELQAATRHNEAMGMVVVWYQVIG